MDNINYLGWESNFSIRPPRVFKILSTKFQWTQTIERDLVERSAYSKLFVCDRVKPGPLGRRL